ncbi:MAG TPA: phospholipase D-like domain-containing protein [Galbitalea sp.]|jgi:hypothetical protein|nr:phospholipase D-like domain-containing protein [Galbitalea sp.]
MADSAQQISAIIEKHLGDFQKPGVLSVRPGFEMKNGWLTGSPAIVVTVALKRTDVAASDILPDELDGVAVDVRQASPTKQTRLADPLGYSGRTLTAPDTGAIPEFTDEIDLVGDTPRTLEVLATKSTPKPELPYSAPAGATLAPVTGSTTIHLSASPDSGWPTLKNFLGATSGTLSVSMYDFTSAHILAEVESITTDKDFKLTLDHPAKNPTADQTDEETVAALKKSDGTRLTQAWALERMDPLAADWIFPTAYHIKVAVRDSSSLWLSSGNWNNSNQPDIDPVNNAGDATAARDGDRDWHVVVDHPELASTFEAYVLNDLEIAGAHDAVPKSEALLPAATLPQATTPPFAQFFPAQTITDEMTITPLLTPDAGVYAPAVKNLIASATTSLHLQFQYIELPTTASATSQPFIDLVDAVIERQKAGVDVRIIMSEYETSGYLEQLQSAGLDVVTSVKIQNNVHNKGIVVDGKSVLVSSQNWSTDGTLYNRDAGVIIENTQVAAYFEQIFEHDWAHLAEQKTADD